MSKWLSKAGYTKRFKEFGIKIEQFEALGKFAPAGFVGIGEVLEKAAESLNHGRIPIAGAAVLMKRNGEPEVLAVGCNGRIPAKPGGKGYPVDHGETATIRMMKNISQIPWERVVFATSLDPCIECARTIRALWSRGLRMLAIAEAESFSGASDYLRELGINIVSLTNRQGIEMMKAFADKYPWDWCADIGVFPVDFTFKSSFPFSSREQRRLISQALAIIPKEEKRFPYGAVVTGMNKEIYATAFDERGKFGGNPTFSAIMRAMGKAGSAVNFKNTVVVIATPSPTEKLLAVEEFGLSSLGVCELVGPAHLLTNTPLEGNLADCLQRAGVNVRYINYTG